MMSIKKIFVFLSVCSLFLILGPQAKAATAWDVILNEISWKGSSATDTDEWIELRNTTASPIDLNSWTIDNAVHGATTTLTLNNTICSTTTIPVSGYFLIGNSTSGFSAINDAVTVECATSSINLIDSYLLNGALVLKDSAGNVIDQTPASSSAAWTAGAGAPATSTMSRDWGVANGAAVNMWHSPIIANNWDAGIQDKGTPKSYNGYPFLGEISQLNGTATGTIYIEARIHSTTTATATANFSAAGTYETHLFQATYDLFAFRDINNNFTYNDGSEPRQSLDNSGAGYNLTSSGSTLNFALAVNPVISSTTPSFISIGETLTIIGTYFGDSTTTSQGTITIPNNITNARIVSWSSTSIQVVIPSAATPPGPQTGQLQLRIGSWLPATTTLLTIQPIVTSAAATQNSVAISFDSYIDGAFAMAPGNYTLESPIGTSVPITNAWTEFRGNKVYIKGISLTSGNTFSITAGSSIKSVSGTSVKTASSTATGTVSAAPAITSVSPNSGAVGATTTITGTGFGAATGTVYFSPGPPTGGTPPNPVQATISSWTDTRIIAFIPAGAKSGPINILTNSGAESGMSENGFFDVPANLNFSVLKPNGSPVATSTVRIVIGKMGGPSLYYIGDSNGTTYSNGTTTIPNGPSMGYSWAYDASGIYTPAKGREINSATTTIFNLASSTSIISGTITGASANSMLALFADSVKGTVSGTSTDFFEPVFIVTNANGTTSFNIGLSATGTYIVGVEDPGFGGASSAKLAPAVQQINASSTTNISGITFAFTTATARIHGKIQKAVGNFAGGPGTNEFHVWAYQPIENGLHASAMIDSNGEFDLYVDPGVYLIEAGGPNIPFPVRKQIEIKSGDANFAITNSTTDITLIISAPTEYISGQVTDSNGNGISGASIFGWSTTGPGGGQSITDSNGSYKLYVNPGTYTVEGFAPSYGKLTSRSGVTVSSNSSTTVDFSVSSEMATISGTVAKNSASSSNMEVWITQGENGYNINRTQTDASGNYTLRVPYGSGYYLHIGKPGVGEVYKEALAVFNSGNTSTSSIISINTVNIAYRISPSSAFSQAFIEARHSTDPRKRGSADRDTSATTSYREYVIEVPKPSNNETWTYFIDGGIPNYGPLGATTTSISSTTASVVKTITLGNIYTVSGTISDPDSSSAGNQAEGAFVWAASANGHGGGQVDSSGNFSFSLKAGTYDFGIDKKNYAGTIAPNVAVNSAATITGLSLSSAGLTIAGQVTKSGAAESGAWVWATNGSGGWSGDQTDGSGNYSLKVTSGTWSIKAASEGYETPFSQSVAVSSGTTTLNLALSAMANYTVASPTVESIVPKDGGIIQGGNVKFEVPAGSLSSQDSNNGRVSIQKTTSVPQTNGLKPLGNLAYTISASNASGTAFTTLNSDVTISLTYSATDLTAASATQAQASRLSLGYWDSTANTWTSIPTSVATSTDGSVTFTGNTNHLSDFAPMVSSGSNPPPTPTGLTATAGHQYITLSWSASSGATKYDIYRKSGDSYPYLSQTTATTYTNSGLTNGTTYYYKVSALNDDNDESTSTDAVSATPYTPSAATSGGGGGGGDSSLSVPTTATGQVTATAAAGGKTTITSAESTIASVTLPVNAVSANTTVTITPTAKSAAAVSVAAAAVPAGKSLVGSYVYNYSAAAGGAAISSFAKSITLTFTYTDSQIIGLNESTLKVYYWNATSSQWITLTTTVNSQTNTLTAATDHFTYFAIIGEPAEAASASTTSAAATTTPIAQMTIAELQSEIIRITALILQLQVQLNELLGQKAAITGIPADFKFKLTLKSGQVSIDVKYLQIVLNSDSETRIAVSGAGSSGNETNLFGPLTKRALIKFQKKYASEILTPWGLTEGTGLAGETTRTKLNELLKNR